MSDSSNGFALWCRPALSGPEGTGGCAHPLMNHCPKSYLEYVKSSLRPSPDMNGESDKPAAVLIGIADEDASELPPLQPPKSSGKAKKTRQIPNAGILNP